MVKEEIIGGLKLALQRGDSLRRAMMTFYEAGYLKEEIEQAARELSANMLSSQKKPAVQPEQELKADVRQGETVQKISNYEGKKLEEKKAEQEVVSKSPVFQEQQPLQEQKVSEYHSMRKKQKKNPIIIILTVLLILLVLSLVGVIIFKDKIIIILNNLFSSSSA